MANTHKILKAVLASTIGLLLLGCHHQQDSSAILTVEATPITKTLFFSGQLQPNAQVNITSPVDGIIQQQNFTYGQPISKGQLLYTIQASKEQSDFENAFTAYLKAKESLNNSTGNLQSTQELYKEGLVSRDEYNQAKSSYYLDQLSMIQAKNDLINIMKSYKMNTSLLNLSIDDIDAIKNAINASAQGSTIQITSPVEGVALFPNNNSDSSSSSNSQNTIGIGSEVKLAQVLVNIGQYQGLAMQAQVNEININQVKQGMPVTITGDAFNGITLQGKIAEVDSQANNSGNTPVFNIRIVIPELSPQALQAIRIGMSAKAALTIQLASKISIPIAGVFQKNDQTYVNKWVNGEIIPTPIMTGETSATDVVVVSGLNPGDQIVLAH